MSDTLQTYATEIVRLFPLQGQWTEADYFNLPETNQIVELSDGMIIVPNNPTDEHQTALLNLAAELRAAVKEKDLGRVYIAAFAVRLWEGKIRQPDVLFVRQENLGRVHKTVVDGPADWVAEIISPGNRSADEVEKLAEYAQAGIPEYWLIDLEAKTIRVYVLRGGETYTLAATYGTGQVARSETIAGFAVAVDEVIA